MRLNRKRKDARFPQWILEALAAIQIKYQWTFTEALMRCAEKGIVYYNKQWDKMHEKEKPVEGSGSSDERCPNESPKEKIPQQEEVSDEQIDWEIAGLPFKDENGRVRLPTEEERKKKFKELQAKDKEK